MLYYLKGVVTMQKTKYEIEYGKLMERISGVFRSKSGIRNAQNYIKGLLSPAERKNGWQMSEEIGESTPYKIQQFLYRGGWSANELRDVTRNYIGEEIGEEDGTLVLDETGFLKQGKKSCGVARQYSGTAGRIENSQIGVFLTYATKKGNALIDRRLYLPKEWMKDTARCKEAGVPQEVTFQTKPKMGLEMLKEAYQAGVAFTWVTGDCIYGDFRDIRMWVESVNKHYVMSVSGKEYVWIGSKQHKIGALLKTIPEEAWFEASCGHGSKGERIYEWYRTGVNSPDGTGCNRWLLVRRNRSKPEERRAYVCYAPEDMPASELIRVAGIRWTVETCFAESKSEVGLDQYEVRSYGGWYKHITLVCLAHAFLTVLKHTHAEMRSVEEDGFEESSQTIPTQHSLSEFKKKRGLSV